MKASSFRVFPTAHHLDCTCNSPIIVHHHIYTVKGVRKLHLNCSEHSNLPQENYIIQLIQQYGLTGSLKINKPAHSEIYQVIFFQINIHAVFQCSVRLTFMLNSKLAMKMGTWISPNESLLELINNSCCSLIDSL